MVGSLACAWHVSGKGRLSSLPVAHESLEVFYVAMFMLGGRGVALCVCLLHLSVLSVPVVV